jgi:hypothetical protein
MSAPLAITEDARLECEHGGVLDNAPSQDILRIDGRRVLVAKDPEGRHIHNCPFITPSTRPCITSLMVGTGYSTLVAVHGHQVCLASLSGVTDGTPPGAQYNVRAPGELYVMVSQ